MEIHQLLVSASAGDAITNAAFELRELLRRVGPSEIYACYHDDRLTGEVHLLSHYARRTGRPGANVLVFHASIGEPRVLSFLMERPERVVLMYHNISPAEGFVAYDPAFAGLLEAGRRDLATLRDRVALALAVSPYNARELQALGYRDVRVTPLISDVRGLVAVEPDPESTHHLQTQMMGPVVLFVGQLLPHKRSDLLVKAYHVLVNYLVPAAHLVLVGPARLPQYRNAVQQFVKELRLPGAWLTGPVSLEQLVAFYRRADVFVTASEHEGFCLPVIEAMAFGVPVIARARAALPETMEDAGVLVPGDADPLLLAEAMATLIEDRDLRARVVEAGHRRVEDFDADRGRAAVLEQLLEVS